MIVSALSMIGGIIGPVLLRMGLAAISKPVIEKAILDLLQTGLDTYRLHAAKTADPGDDITAARMQSVFDSWKDAIVKADSAEGT